VTNEFTKAANTNIKGFLKTTGNFMKKYAKNFQPQRLSETTLIWIQAAVRSSVVAALAAFKILKPIGIDFENTSSFQENLHS
jgi:hypothetical protein